MGILDKEESSVFELDMVIRDKDGNPIGRKAYSSDKMENVADFWHKNKLVRKKKRHRDLGILAPEQAEKLLTELFGEPVDDDGATAEAE